MSVEGMKADLDALLDKLRAGELKDTPIMIWWHDKAKDEATIYAQQTDTADALTLVATITHAFKLSPVATLIAISKTELGERVVGEAFLYHRLGGNGGSG